MIGKFIINTMWLLLMIAISGLIYVRTAPHDTAALHVPPPMDAAPDGPVMKDNSGLFVQMYDVPPAEILEIFNTVALDTKRTRILAGSAEERMITYVTRSWLFGFPDYTTVQAVAEGQGSRVTIYARLRFGLSDFGVNSTRVRSWLGIIEALN